MSYIPLFVQSGYSFLNSALRIEEIFSYAEKYNNRYVALCDECSLTGFPHLAELCRKKGITPVMGISIKISTKNGLFPVCLFVRNEEGYRSLCRLISRKEEITSSSISEYKKGLILIVPVISNEIIHNLIRCKEEKTLSRILFSLQDGFDDFYLGTEYYSSSDYESVQYIRNFASSHSYKCIAFPKNLYLKKHDAIALEILNSIKNATKLDETKNEGPYYMLNEKAWNLLYTEEEISNTEALCRNTDFTFFSKRGMLLSYPLEEDKKEYILKKCEQRISLLSLKNKNVYLERVRSELDIISKMGYLDYFLVTQDFVNYGKSKNIPIGPGRGSACGSLVSYLLNITEIDPLKYGLIFERFLNPDRVTMPDIDVDISDLRHNEIIDYLRFKYSDEKICAIRTIQTFGAKQALKDIGNILGVNGYEISLLSSYIKDSEEKLSLLKENDNNFRNLMKDTYLQKIVNYACLIEGLPRQSSVHPAGIILNNDSLCQCLPLDKENGKLISQYEAPYLEEQNFLKMDLLKLSTLSVIEKIVVKIKKINPDFDYNKIDFSDSETFKVLNQGFTLGLFQIESQGITNALKEIQINNFEDIYALLALYRPGPMDQIELYAERKNKGTSYSLLSTDLSDILSPTYGIIIYQEQIMNICQKCASFTYAESDLFRRAISKKDASKIESFKDKFILGCTANGMNESDAKKIYELIYKFSDFGFNKSHAVAYAHILYKMAYMKAHYPSSFYEVLLDNESLNQKKYYDFKKELDYFSLSIKSPDLNISKKEFLTYKNALYVPFTMIKGLPQSVAVAIEKMQENGPFTSFPDFIIRSSLFEFSAANYIALIESGALDIFNISRSSMKKSLTSYIEYVKFFYKDGKCIDEEYAALQKPSIINIKDDEVENDIKEFNLLGFRTKLIIQAKYHDFIEKNHIRTLSNISKSQERYIAIISNIKRIITKKRQEPMAFINIYDESEMLECVLFPENYKAYGELIKENRIYLFTGYIDESRKNSFIITKIEKMED